MEERLWRAKMQILIIWVAIYITALVIINMAIADFMTFFISVMILNIINAVIYDSLTAIAKKIIQSQLIIEKEEIEI